MFSGAKKMSNFFKKPCSVRSKKLHEMKLKKVFIFDKIIQKNLFQLCLAPIETPHRGTYLYDFERKRNFTIPPLLHQG